MSTARDHTRFDELAVGWALYALEPDDEQVLVRHLPTCGRCQRTVHDAEATMATVAMVLPGPQPSPKLLERIHEATGAPSAPAVVPAPVDSQQADVSPAEADIQRADVQHVAGHPDRRSTDIQRRAAPRHGQRPGSNRSSRPGSARHSRSRRIALVAAVVALLFAVGLGAWNVNLRAANHRQQQVAAQLIRDSRVATLIDQHGAKQGYVVNQNGKLEVVSDGLPTNDSASSIYALWSVSGTGGTPQLVGVFDNKKSDLGVQPVGSVPPGMNQVTTMAVSKEPGRGTPTRPTVIVASGAVNN